MPEMTGRRRSRKCKGMLGVVLGAIDAESITGGSTVKYYYCTTTEPVCSIERVDCTEQAPRSLCRSDNNEESYFNTLKHLCQDCCVTVRVLYINVLYNIKDET